MAVTLYTYVTKLAIRYQTRDPIPRHHIAAYRSPWPVRSGQGRGLLCAHGSCIVRPVELGHKGARSADRAACSSPVGHGSRGWSRARQSAEQPCAHAASASMATAAASPPCRRRAAACVCVRRRAQQSFTNDKADIGSYGTRVTSIQTLLLRNSSPKAFQRYLTRLLTLSGKAHLHLTR